MKQQLTIRAIAGLILLLLFPAASHAGPIRIAFHDTTIVGGMQFDYPVYIDSSLTGSGVSAYEIEFTYNNSIFTLVSVRSESTMTASWGIPEYNIVSSGKIRIAGAGPDTLSGTGKLLILRFSAGVYTYANAGYFTFQNMLLNQGTPTTIKRDGYVYVNPPPSITVSPDTWLMTKGESKQFTVSGGKNPYTWSSINPSAATINSTGLLTSLTAGFTRVVCVDSSGYADTSGAVEVRAVKIYMRDTSKYQGQWLDLPVYATDATGLGITSGQFTVTYNSNLWAPNSIITAGTLLNGWTAELGTPTLNQMNVVFSSSSQLSGSGVLLYIRMKATATTYGSVNFGFLNPFFNELIPANNTGAYITIMQLPPVNISPGGSHTLIAGDSIQFSASGGTPPYTWAVSDPLLASISSNGWLKGIKSGTVSASAQDFIGATGNSGPVNIYDFRMSVPDTSLIPAGAVDIPIFVTPNIPGFSSLQFKVTYSTGSYVKLTDVISAGTLVEGWSIDKLLSAGSATIAGGGVNAVHSGGMLLKLRFTVPDSTPRPSTIYISLTDVVFDQGVPLPLIDNGYFTVANSSVFGITPSSGMIQTSAVSKKDSTTFTVHNSGTATLTASMGITGSGEFTLSTYNISVPPSGDAVVRAYYLPVNAGGDTATINFYTNDPYHATVPVTIIGKVLQFPIVGLSKTTIDFGSVNVGQFKDTTVTITNSGSDTLKITAIAANNGVFTARPAPANIPPGNSFVDTLRFTPAAATVYNARYLVTSNASSSPDTIHVSGTGILVVFPVLTLSTHVIDFGIVQTANFKDTTVTITNSGTDTLKISGIAANNGVFTSKTSSVNIPPGNSFVDTLRFSPIAITTYNARFLVTSNAASSPDTITVTGRGDLIDRAGMSTDVPKEFGLKQNYPNPFNPSTTIQYAVPGSGYVTLNVFDLLGKEAATLVNEHKSAGNYSVTFDARDLPSGIYFYQLRSGNFVEIKKMMFLK